MSMWDKIKKFFGFNVCTQASSCFCVLPCTDGWMVKHSKESGEILETFDTRAQAIVRATSLASMAGGKLMVYKKDGELQYEKSYNI